MIYVYAGIFAVLLISALACLGYKKSLFRGLDKKEHSFRLFYPLAARLVDLFRSFSSKRDQSKVTSMLKSLHVKENVEEEQYVYSVKKTATVLLILAAVSLLGALFCFSRMGIETIQNLERNSPGGGVHTYELEADYKDSEEIVEIPVGEEKYTEEEILEIFNLAIEDIRTEMLGENEDADHVSKPLHFMLQKDGIHIYWDIEDTDIIGYNGEISAELEENESIVLNLYATLTMDDVSETYNLPVVVVAPTFTEKELLVQGIIESIEENNDVYEKEVQLPESINGDRIAFRKTKENNDTLILILGLLAVVVIIIGYDKGLENKVKKRKEQMMIDFTEIVSKLSLMYGAGSSILKSWEKIVADQEKRGESRFAYQEMKLVLEKIRSGVRERDAYAQFGKRCGLHPYIKLGNILEQNLSKGAKGMKLLLKQETEDAFEERKRLARKKGEEAGTKMLFPMILMMLVVVVIVAVPALMSINL